MVSKKLAGVIAGGAVAIGAAFGGYAIDQSHSISTSSNAVASSQSTSTSGTAGRLESVGGESNARSGPAAGGAAGTIGTVTTSGFTMTTSGGQKVTVTEASTTTYQNGTASTSASAVTTGIPVLVLGTTNGTIITATQVIVHPASGAGSSTYTASPVVPFKKGAPAPSTQDGKIRRTTPRVPGRSSAERRRTRRRKLRWPSTRAASSTVS